MKKDFLNGFFKENPVFVILLGLCPSLGVTSKVEFAIGMGAGVIFVLLGSNIFVSLLKNFIPDKIRIPAYIVIIASFVTIVEMLMKAFVPPLYNSLGVFVPLIVVNCVILGRAEAFASKNSVGASIIDAISMGIGFTIALVVIAFVRELLGNGTVAGLFKIPLLSNSPIRVFGFAAGALLVIGYLKALWDVLLKRFDRRNNK